MGGMKWLGNIYGKSALNSVARRVEKLAEKLVEKLAEKPAARPVARPVAKRVEKPSDEWMLYGKLSAHSLNCVSGSSTTALARRCKLVRRMNCSGGAWRS